MGQLIFNLYFCRPNRAVENAARVWLKGSYCCGVGLLSPFRIVILAYVQQVLVSKFLIITAEKAWVSDVFEAFSLLVEGILKLNLNFLGTYRRSFFVKVIL